MRHKDPLDILLELLENRATFWDFGREHEPEVVYKQRCDVSKGGVKLLRDGRDRGLWVRIETTDREEMVLLDWQDIGRLGKYLTEQHKEAKLRDAPNSDMPLKWSKDDKDESNGPTGNPVVDLQNKE